MGRRGRCGSGVVAGRLDALFAEGVDGASEAEEMREASAEDEAAAEDMNCSGGKFGPDERGLVGGRGERRCLSKMTVRVEEDPGTAGSAARALATDPEGRAECCAAKPGSRDLGPFEGMTWVVEFCEKEVYPMKQNRRSSRI